jgi:hypothetical protein
MTFSRHDVRQYIMLIILRFHRVARKCFSVLNVVNSKRKHKLWERKEIVNLRF